MFNFFNKDYKEISPRELSVRMKDRKLKLIDCRESDELIICKIKEFTHIPMQEIPNRMNEYNKEDDLYIFCHSGNRSATVCKYLHQNGFESVYNIVGGILAWSDEVDSSIQKY